ncbi:CDP-alcohol phosphatidyltransferase family protein [Patescibacteria group bacterium]
MEKINITIIDKAIAATFLKLLPKWVTPNHITIFRFLTIPFVILLMTIGSYGWGAVLFIISALSDALDGALARTTNKVTDWGKMFDPLADKLLIGTTAVILIPNFLSVWLAVVIVVIELIIILSAYYQKHYKDMHVQADKSGKAKMVFQSIGVGVLFIYVTFPIPLLLIFAQYTLYTAVFFALLQMLVYRSI